MAAALARGWVAVLVALAVLLAPGGAASAASKAAAGNGRAGKGRAMWLWQQAPAGDVISWATAHDVRDIFVYFPADATDLTWYRALKTRADAAHVTLDALGGDPSWITDGTAVGRWMAAVKRANLFAGLHVDVEPYTLPAWSTAQGATVTAYLRTLSLLKSDLPVEVDVPFWYATIPVPGGGNLAEAVLARIIHLTVMTYRDTATGANSLMDVATDMLTRSRAHPGDTIRLAVETQPLTDCPYCTFYAKGQAAMSTAMSSVDTLASGYPDYAGIAVHHYQSWRALRA